MKTIKDTSWIETHFEVVSAITRALNEDGDKYPKPTKVLERAETQGTGGLYELSEELTDKFQEEYKDHIWDGDFFDIIEEWLFKELY